MSLTMPFDASTTPRVHTINPRGPISACFTSGLFGVLPAYGVRRLRPEPFAPFGRIFPSRGERYFASYSFIKAWVIT
jgi:hypothetical protein